MPAGPLLAVVVQQPLRDVLPDGLAAGQPDGIGLLDLDGSAAASAGDPEQVVLNVGEPLRPDRRAGRAGIGARLPMYLLTTRNSAMMAAWLVVIE